MVTNNPKTKPICHTLKKYQYDVYKDSKYTAYLKMN